MTMTPVEVRSQLVDALRLDLVGPDATRSLGMPDEVLPQPPSRWYLTGFLVPLEADETQRSDETSTEELDGAGDAKISGPLGTMMGLYESALDELCRYQREDHSIRPKIIASTATVRRAESQIRALFNRQTVDIFPPPGPDRRNSFFALVHTTDQSNARLYAGVAAQGRSLKVVMLRVYLALLAAAQKAYDA